MNFFAALARVGFRLTPIMEKSCGYAHIRVYLNERAIEVLCERLSRKELPGTEWTRKSLFLDPKDYVNIVVEYDQKIVDTEYAEGLNFLIDKLEL